MEEFILDGDKEQKEGEGDNYGEISSSEEAFMKGYMEEGDVEECEECGGALEHDKRVVREIGDEKHLFCSNTCADDFEESIN